MHIPGYFLKTKIFSLFFLCLNIPLSLIGTAHVYEGIGVSTGQWEVYLWPYAQGRNSLLPQQVSKVRDEVSGAPPASVEEFSFFRHLQVVRAAVCLHTPRRQQSIAPPPFSLTFPFFLPLSVQLTLSLGWCVYISQERCPLSGWAFTMTKMSESAIWVLLGHAIAMYARSTEENLATTGSSGSVPWIGGTPQPLLLHWFMYFTSSYYEFLLNFMLLKLISIRLWGKKVFVLSNEVHIWKVNHNDSSLVFWGWTKQFVFWQ